MTPHQVSYRHLLPLAFVAMALAAMPTKARAAGLSIPDLYTTAQGQGAAVVASPDDFSAAYYNPAGFADQTGLRLQLDTRTTWHMATFQRHDAEGGNFGEEVRGQGGPSFAPSLGASYRFDLGKWPSLTIGVGAHPFPGFAGYSYPDPTEIRKRLKDEDPELDDMYVEEAIADEASQRYSTITAGSIIYVPSVSIASSLTSWLDVGLTLQTPIANFNQSQSVFAGLGTGEDPGFDAKFSIDATALSLSALLGASIKLPANLTLGVSVQLPTHFEANGTIKADLPESLQALASMSGEKASLEIDFPLVARAGLRYAHKAFEVELAGTYEAWSQQKEIKLKPKDIQITKAGETAPLEEMTIPRNFQDAGSVRFGGLVRPGVWVEALDFLTVRAGVLYETSAVQREYQTLEIANWERLTLNAGLSAKLGDYELAVAYSRFMQPDIVVSNSKAMQTAINEGVEPTIVGNGRYGSQIDMLGVTLLAHWGI